MPLFGLVISTTELASGLRVLAPSCSEKIFKDYTKTISSTCKWLRAWRFHSTLKHALHLCRRTSLTWEPIHMIARE